MVVVAGIEVLNVECVVLLSAVGIVGHYLQVRAQSVVGADDSPVAVPLIVLGSTGLIEEVSNSVLLYEAGQWRQIELEVFGNAHHLASAPARAGLAGLTQPPGPVHVEVVTFLMSADQNAHLDLVILIGAEDRRVRIATAQVLGQRRIEKRLRIEVRIRRGSRWNGKPVPNRPRLQRPGNS